MRPTPHIRVLTLALCSSILLAACGGDGTTTPPAKTLSSIAVSPTTASLTIGGTQALTVTGTYSDATTAALTSGVTYTSSSTTIASVSGTGLVTAAAAGTATITAAASGKTATATITVAAPAPTLTAIAVTPTTVSLAPAATRQLTVTGTYSDATTGALTSGVTFASSATSVATVSGTGLITAVAAGTSTITATHTASTRTSTATVTVTAASGGPVVFLDEYNAGVSFADFGGATNAVTVDATTLNNGRKTIKAVITGSGGYSGGALVAATPRNLSTFNALTFWAKASVAKSSLKVGIGNNAANTLFNAESIGIPLTTTFTKFIIPVPNPSKFTAADGLFHFADGPNNYTVWFSDIQYETLPVAQLAAATEATAGWPSLTIAIGSPQQISPAPNTVRYTTPALPNGGILSDVAWRWYTLTSSNPAVATVSADGLVTGVSAGTATISATMNGLTVAGTAPITVTVPLAVPTTIAPAPTRASADVISLFTTVYTNRGVDTWRTGWSANNNELTDPFAVSGRNIKKYSLFNFVGVEYGIATPANIVDATTMTHFHVDLWSPNPPSNIEIQLVNDAAGTAAIGKYQTGQLGTGSWISLDIPLANFTGLTVRNKLQQLLFVASSPTVIYVDNVYFRK